MTFLRAYFERAKLLRKGETRLLINFKKPHKRISRNNLRRWTKTMANLAGIRMDIFTPNSTRAASNTKVVDRIPVKSLLQTAGLRGRNTFVTSTTRIFRRKDHFL